MYWVIESNTFNEPFYDKLLSFLDKVDIPYEVVKLVPFSWELIPEPSPTQEHVITIGSYTLTHVAVDRGWIPGAFVNGNYDYRIWSKAYNGHCLNGSGIVSKFGEVKKREGDFFIRPCEDTKLFTGHVKNWGEFEEWQDSVINSRNTYTSLDYDSMVFTSELKNIEEEYRFIVIDGKVITGSLYKSGRTTLYQECTNPDVINFVQQMVGIWIPSRAFALDIALSDGEYFVLEMGCMNSAGLYECDVQKIVMALESMIF